MALTKADIETLKGILAEQRPSHDCSDDINKMLQAQVLQSEQIKNLTDNMKQVKETLYGNGKPGLTTVVNGLVDRAGQSRWFANSVTYIVLGLCVGAIFYLILSHGIVR